MVCRGPGGGSLTAASECCCVLAHPPLSPEDGAGNVPGLQIPEQGLERLSDLPDGAPGFARGPQILKPHS